LASLQAKGETLVTTLFNIAEMWVGVYRSRDREAELARTQTVVRPLPVLEFDRRSAIVFGQIVAGLRAEGNQIGDMDALIASVCLAAGHSILTRDPAHFSRVAGLAVETY